MYVYIDTYIYTHIYNICFILLYINNSFFSLSIRESINISFIRVPGLKEIVTVSGVRSKLVCSSRLGALVKGLISYMIYVKSRFILDLTHMIEVSSKFVCCLARISQPRGDLNPERCPSFKRNAPQTPHCISTNAKPAGITMLLVTVECLHRPKFMFKHWLLMTIFSEELTIFQEYSSNYLWKSEYSSNL